MRFMLSLLLCPFFLTAVTASANDARPPVPLIFDTDMMGDVDDVGTTALLHALADRGEVRILAMGLSGKNPWSPPCLSALNTYFGRSDIPIGIVKGPAFNRKSPYAETIAQEFPHTLKSADEAPNAALLYRKILAQQPDKSAVMVSVGQLTNFKNLLMTSPDKASELDGRNLVAQKVRCWVCMGGTMPQGRESNLIHDGPAAAYAIANWPTPIIFSGWEIGQEIMTGARLRSVPQGTPVRRAYELYNGLKNRQSWDQTAVLYAVRGLDGGLKDYWDVVSGGHLHVRQDGSNEWRESPDKNHSYLVRKMSPKKIAAVIEALMLHQPQTNPKNTQKTGTLRVATCQFPVSKDIVANAQWIRQQMRDASEQGADIAHFPETALSGYAGVDLKNLDNFDWDLQRAEFESILSLARSLKLWVIVGATHQLTGDHKPHNSLYVINDRGQVVDRYDKRFCTGGDLRHYSPGDHFVTFDVNGVRCGLLICYDIRFPELYRQYLKLGAQVIFHSFYNARQQPGAIHPKIMPPTAQARAATNYMFLSVNNSCAPHSWASFFVTPDGLIQQRLPLDKPGVMINLVDTEKRYYDASQPYRLECIAGKWNSGKTVDDPRSKNRHCY